MEFITFEGLQGPAGGGGTGPFLWPSLGLGFWTPPDGIPEGSWGINLALGAVLGGSAKGLAGLPDVSPDSFLMFFGGLDRALSSLGGLFGRLACISKRGLALQFPCTLDLCHIMSVLHICWSRNCCLNLRCGAYELSSE